MKGNCNTGCGELFPFMKLTMRYGERNLKIRGKEVIPLALDGCGQLEHSHCRVNGRKEKKLCVSVVTCETR